MTDQRPAGHHKASRARVIVIVTVMIAVVIAAVVVGMALTTGNSQTRGPESTGTTAPAVEPSAALPEQTPVPIGDGVEVLDGVTVTISEFRAVDGEAQGAGEIAGPAVQFEVTIQNTTSELIDAAAVQVNLYTGEARTPTVPLSGPGAELFPATIAAGGNGTATFVFAVDPSSRDLLTAVIDYRAGVPAAVFTGSAPAD